MSINGLSPVSEVTKSLIYQVLVSLYDLRKLVEEYLIGNISNSLVISTLFDPLENKVVGCEILVLDHVVLMAFSIEVLEEQI